MFKKALLLLAFAFPFAVSAASIHIGDFFLRGAESVPSDLYVLGRTATFAGFIQGDAMSIDRTIFSQSDISGDALFVGEEVTVEGEIADDARLLGNVITIDGDIADDVVAIGAKIILGPKAHVGGSFYAAGGEVEVRGTVAEGVQILSSKTVISGQIEKDVEVWGDASFEKPAKIGGDFIQHGNKKLVSLVNVSIAGKVILDKKSADTDMLAARSLFGGLFSLKVLMLLALAFSLFFLSRERAENVLLEILPAFWHRTLRGLLILVVVPVIILLLLPTVVGIPIALILSAALLILILLSWGYAGMLLGVWSERIFFKRSAFPLTYRPVLFGCIFLSIISLIPFVGSLFHAILMMAVAGSLGTLFFRSIRRRR